MDFRKGRITTDGMFSLRQLDIVERRSERHGNMALMSVDLEKALTRFRTTAMATLRWMGAS